MERRASKPIQSKASAALRGSEAKAFLSFRRKQSCEGLIRIIAAIAIYEGLGNDKAAGESDRVVRDTFRDGVRSLPPENRHS